MIGGLCNNKTIFTISCHEGEMILPNIRILTNKKVIIIDENQMAITYYDETKKVIENNNFKISYQSELSNLYVEEIIEKGKCELPNFSTSKKIHIALMRALIEFQKSLEKENYETCKIT